jgi:hypothetical protein
MGVHASPAAAVLLSGALVAWGLWRRSLAPSGAVAALYDQSREPWGKARAARGPLPCCGVGGPKGGGRGDGAGWVALCGGADVVLPLELAGDQGRRAAQAGAGGRARGRRAADGSAGCCQRPWWDRGRASVPVGDRRWRRHRPVPEHCRRPARRPSPLCVCRPLRLLLRRHVGQRARRPRARPACPHHDGATRTPPAQGGIRCSNSQVALGGARWRACRCRRVQTVPCRSWELLQAHLGA